MPVKLENVFDALIKQSDGYSFGKPKRVDDKSLTAVLPILRVGAPERDYISFPETDKCLVFDTGRIDVMEADNKTDQHVFIRSGTLFRGSTQERALQRSHVVLPNSKQPLAVRCVHATRRISHGAEVKYKGLTPLSFDQSNYDPGYKPKSQHDYWSNVTKATTEFAKLSGDPVEDEIRHAAEPMDMHAYLGDPSSQVRSRISSRSDGLRRRYGAAVNAIGAAVTPNQFKKMDDLTSAMDDFSSKFDDVLSKIKIDDNQAGLALITEHGVQTIECFDHPTSWRALHENAVKRMGAELVKEDQKHAFEFREEHAVMLVTNVLALPFKRELIHKHNKENGDHDIRITGLSFDGKAGNYVGEAVEVNDRLIHLVILKTT